MNQLLCFGDILPTGWLKSEIENTLAGCIGHLDDLVPGLIKEHKIYGKDRLHSKSKLAALGRMEEEKPEVIAEDDQFYWWNSETQSNWLDGFLRSAFLVQDPVYMEKAERYARELLSTQTEEGYLGIYSEELRFQCKGENGELWAQSTALRALLAYYEATGKEEILNAVIRAANCTMQGFPLGKSSPFCVKGGFSGHGHGLTAADAFYRLFEHTKDKKYVDYAVWLYEDYSQNVAAEEDLQIKNVENPDYIFKGHGVHTYEMIRALIIAAGQKEEYKRLLNLVYGKLPYYLTPSGGAIGDEWIFGRTADAGQTGYEYCSLQELMDTYLFQMRVSGQLKWADKAEWLFYNAGFGMRHPSDSSIMYLKTDNCYEADSKKQPGSVFNPRYKYSPTHQDVAVCCVPNSGRIMPYFVQNMLIPYEEEIKIALYGPMKYEGNIKGSRITIEQLTQYPSELTDRIEIHCDTPVTFTLSLRFPGWADTAVINGTVYNKKDQKEAQISIRKLWDKDEITVAFTCGIRFQTDFHQNRYVCYGPLLFALPVESYEVLLKELPLKPFAEKGYLPVSREYEGWKIKEHALPQFKLLENEKTGSFKDLVMEGRFYDGTEEKTAKLKPMGATILRRATFETVWEETGL